MNCRDLGQTAHEVSITLPMPGPRGQLSVLRSG